MCSRFYKENVFLTGLILNIISSVIIIILIILCGIQYNYIKINWTKINPYQNLCDFELSFCILYFFTCILGFIVFIKSLECKTMQKIYIIYAILTWVYSVVVCVICFISAPKIIKYNSDTNCESLNLKGILQNFYKFENIFYEVNNYFCSEEIINFQKCSDVTKNEAFDLSLLNLNNSNKKMYENFNKDKFMSYWSKIEKKFKCVGLCNTSYISDIDNNLTNISNYLFSDNTKPIDNTSGCIFPLSDWLNKMIISFACLLIVNIVLSVICIYICFAIYYDKVYEGSNYPDIGHIKGIISKSENKQIEIIKGNLVKNKSIDNKITNEKY